MSTHIIDQVAAVKFPKERTGHYDHLYLIATEGGSNNCFNSQTGKRARAWSPMQAGQHYKCLARACEWAADFCGGCARMNRLSPEGFIRHCRQTLDTAPDYDSPNRAITLERIAITFNAEEKVAHKFYYERLLEKRGQPEQRDQGYLRGDLEAFPFNYQDSRDMACFIEHLPYQSPLWHHVTVIPTRW